MPSPITIIQCQRVQGSRSIRAGMSVVIWPVSTPLDMCPPRGGRASASEDVPPAARKVCAAEGRGTGRADDETKELDTHGADLNGKTIAFLVAPEGIEQVELTEPWQAVEKAGGTPQLLSTEPGEVQAFNHLDKADTFAVDAVVADADPASYDGLVLPGGVANPDALRIDEDAVAFVRAFVESAGRWPRSVTRRGRWPRPTSCAAAG